MGDKLTLQELKDHCIKTLQTKEMMASQINGIRFQSDKVEQEHRMVLDLILEHEHLKEHDAQVRADAIEEVIKMLNDMEEKYRAEIAEKDCMNDDPFSDGILSAMFTVIKVINQLKDKQ